MNAGRINHDWLEDARSNEQDETVEEQFTRIVNEPVSIGDDGAVWLVRSNCWLDQERIDEVCRKLDGLVTLQDYVETRHEVVLYWAGVGTPMGQHVPLCHPDLDFAERNKLWQLHGAIGDGGEWEWDGEGDPRDDNGNTIYLLTAATDSLRWRQIVDEYESDVC